MGEPRFVIDASTLRPGRMAGFDRFVLAVIEHLPAALPVYRWTVVTRADVTVDAPPGVEVVELRSPSRLIRDQWELPAALAKLDPVATLFPGFPPPLLIPGATKVIVVIHDAALWKFPQTLARSGRWYYKPVLEWGLRRRRIDGVLTQSRAAEAELRQYVPPGIPIRGIPLGISQIDTPPDGGRAGDGDEFILAVGTVEPRKNYETLLEAWELLVARGVEVPLKIVGRPGWGKQPVVSPRLQPLVSMEGAVSDAELARLYESCAAFVMPSIHEGFGFPLAEAMLRGKRCLVSDIAVFREVGAGAVQYVPALSAQEWAAAVEGVWRGPRDVIAEAVETAAQFTWERWAAEAAAALTGFICPRLPPTV